MEKLVPAPEPVSNRIAEQIFVFSGISIEFRLHG
jgi:hypothetical protein